MQTSHRYGKRLNKKTKCCRLRVFVCVLRLNRYASVIDKLHKASLWYPHCSYPAPTPYLCYSNHNRHQIPHRCPIPFPFQCPSPLQLCGESCVCVCVFERGDNAALPFLVCVCVCLQVCVRVFLAWLPLPVARCPLPCLAHDWRASKAKHVKILLYKAIARVWGGWRGPSFVIILLVVVAIFVTVAAALLVVVSAGGGSGGSGGGGVGVVVVVPADCGGGRFSCCFSCCCCCCRGVRCNSLRYVVYTWKSFGLAGWQRQRRSGSSDVAVNRSRNTPQADLFSFHIYTHTHECTVYAASASFATAALLLLHSM